jgi:hypothetical protein
MIESIFDPNLGVFRYDLTEGTAAAESLKAQTKSKDAPDNSILAGIMRLSGNGPAKLNADQVRFLQQALRSLGSAGIPNGTSTKSKASLDDNPSKNNDSSQGTH